MAKRATTKAIKRAESNKNHNQPNGKVRTGSIGKGRGHEAVAAGSNLDLSSSPPKRKLVDQVTHITLDSALESRNLDSQKLYLMLSVYRNTSENYDDLLETFDELDENLQLTIKPSEWCERASFPPRKLFGFVSEVLFDIGIESAKQILALNAEQLVNSSIEDALNGDLHAREEWIKYFGMRVVNKGASTMVTINNNQTTQQNTVNSAMMMGLPSFEDDVELEGGEELVSQSTKQLTGTSNENIIEIPAIKHKEEVIS